MEKDVFDEWVAGQHKKKKYPARRAAAVVLVFGCLFLTLVSCGGGAPAEVVFTGPGLVGLDDTTSDTAPLLSVTYESAGGPVTVRILSDLQSDGDISFDPVTGIYIAAAGPSEVLFGEDSSVADLPEYRAFLTFALDGSTGQPSVPSGAAIDAADLEVFADQVDFASTVPTFIDLIQYQFRGLSVADFNASLVATASYRTVDFFSSDQGNFVDIDVTALMQAAQAGNLALFQVRFELQGLVSGVERSGSAPNAVRSVRTAPREPDKITPRF